MRARFRGIRLGAQSFGGAYFLAVLASAAACTHELGRELTPEFKNTEGRQALATARFPEAQGHYAAALKADPQNREAALGWVLTDLVLLADSPPVRDFVDRCNQPRIDLPGILFGPGGLFARSAGTIQGEAALSIHEFQSPTAGAVRVPFAPDAIRTQVTHPDPGKDRRQLLVSIYERGSGGSWLSLSVNLDDIHQGDQEITPLAPGVVIDLARLDGDLSFLSTAIDSGGERAPSQFQRAGSIQVVKVGADVGAEVELRFDRVEIPVDCAAGTPQCERRLRLEGSIRDGVSQKIDLSPSELPFGDLATDPGPPRRTGLIQAIERANPLDVAFVVNRLHALGDLLAEDSKVLAIALREPGANELSFRLPGQLLFLPEDVPINATDVRALKAWLDLLSAGAELLAQYEYLQGNLQDLLTTYSAWHDLGFEGAPITVQTRDFLPETLARALEPVFLKRQSSFDLSIVRVRLERAFDAAAAALVEPVTAEGILSFQALSTKRLVGEVTQVITSARLSMDSPVPVPLPMAPGYSVHLKPFFDDPLDQGRLRTLTGLAQLWSVRPGNPAGATAEDRNSELRFEPWSQIWEREDPGLIGPWLNGLFASPPTLSERSCTTPMECGQGYVCGVGGKCELDPPWISTDEAWEPSMKDDWPVFVSRTLRDAFDAF